MSFKYTTFHYSQYLQYCDLAYKYNVHNVYTIPSVDEITMEVVTKQDSTTSHNDDTLLSFNLRKYLFLYFVSGRYPKVNCNVFKKLKLKTNNIQNFYYSYILKYCNREHLYHLLNVLFVENRNSLLLNKIFTELAVNKDLNINNSKHFNFKFNITSLDIPEYKAIWAILNQQANAPTLDIKINIVFKKVKTGLRHPIELYNLLYH